MYRMTANICKRTEAGESLKNILYNEVSKEMEKDIPAIRSLVDTTLRNKSTIDDLINSTHLAKEICFSDVWIARVLVAELVFGKRSYFSTDEISKKVYNYKEELRSNLGDAKKKERVFIPRYVRLNTINCTKRELQMSLANEFQFKEVPGKHELNYLEFLNLVKTLKKNEYVEDYHIPNLFIFHPKVQLVSCKLYLEKKIIFQDKASCLVAPLLAPTPGSLMIDMCAAPGFKTQHLATLTGLTGHLFSVEINKERYQTLNATRLNYELKSVLTFNADSLHLPEELTNHMEYIMLDAPCSGSGVVQNYDYGSVDSSRSERRLQSLHNLQAYLLRTALTKYPSARRIVYSTCSINEEENESVIDELLGLAAENEFVLVDLRNHLPDFTVGLESYICGKYCIRLIPEESCTNGFFIALFERTNPPKVGNRSKFYSSFNEIINSVGKKKRKAVESESSETAVESNFNESINGNNMSAVIENSEKFKKISLEKNNKHNIITEEIPSPKKPKVNDKNVVDENDGTTENAIHTPLSQSNHSITSEVTVKNNAANKNLNRTLSSESSSSSSESSSSSDDDSDDSNEKTQPNTEKDTKIQSDAVNTKSVNRTSKEGNDENQQQIWITSRNSMCANEEYHHHSSIDINCQPIEPVDLYQSGVGQENVEGIVISPRGCNERDNWRNNRNYNTNNTNFNRSPNRKEENFYRNNKARGRKQMRNNCNHNYRGNRPRRGRGGSWTSGD